MIREALFLVSLIVAGCGAVLCAHAVGGFNQQEQLLFAAACGVTYAAITADFWFLFLQIDRKFGRKRTGARR